MREVIINDNDWNSNGLRDLTLESRAYLRGSGDSTDFYARSSNYKTTTVLVLLLLSSSIVLTVLVRTVLLVLY